MKKYFLSSMLVMGLMAPAFGADEIITGGPNTCTVDVLGVSDNNATANTIATWTLNEYECGAGQYLLNSDGTLECTECPVGSYCPGGKFTVESENNGTNACPTDYTSDAGAVGENECYMGCELACSTNVECPDHSNNCTHSEFKTTGKQFSGETCNAYPSVCPIADFSCDTGYHKEIIEDVDKFYYDMSDGSVIGSCSLLGQSVYTGVDCEYLEPGNAMTYGFLDGKIFTITIEIAANDYDKNTPGIMSKSFHLDLMQGDIYDTLYYLPYADFSGGKVGNVWGRISKVGIAGPGFEFLISLMNDGQYACIPFVPADALIEMFFIDTPLQADTKQKLSDFVLRIRSGEIVDSKNATNELSLIVDSVSSEDGVIIGEYLMTDIDSLYEILSQPIPDELMQPQTLQATSDFCNAMFSEVSEEEGLIIVGRLLGAFTKYEMQYATTNMPWVSQFHGGVLEEGEDTEPFLAAAIFIFNHLDSHTQLLSLIEPKITASYCASNIINIDWNPANGGAHIQNMCYYDGAIALPSDPVKPGYTFTGWKLVE